jgi:tRNA dimethylallyltransferase
MSAPVRLLIGPTAAGKTRAAVAAARALGGVVLGADARQLYRHFDAATGKEGVAEEVDLDGLGRVRAWRLDGVPQLGIDVAAPDETWTLGRWLDWARPTLEGLRAAGTPPVVAGGTGLYVEALLRGFRLPATDPALRARLEATLPPTSEPKQRALRRAEIRLLGDRPLAIRPDWDARVVGLEPPRAILREAIGRRVEAWFGTAALLDEAAALRRRVPADSRAWSAIGYREALDVLEGRRSVAQAIERCVKRTWDYSRRQRTFFRRRFPEARWVETVDAAVEALAEGTIMRAPTLSAKVGRA